MTMRDNVELAKESAEKSERILQLEDDLACSDMLLGQIVRLGCRGGLMKIKIMSVEEPVDSPAS